MNDIDKLPSKCRDCPYWELAKFPWCCGDCKDRLKKPVSDFVSRQWLIDEYHRRHEGPPGGALKMIEEAPSADVEPVKHGYWYFRGGRPCCSVCNTKALWEDKGGTGGFSHEFVGAKSKRCPECGAHMDAEPPKEDRDAE